MKINMDITDLTNELDDISKKIKEIDETKISLNELLNNNFIQEHTYFANLEEILNEVCIGNNAEDIYKNKENLDRFISENTKFKDLNEMIGKAALEYVLK